MASAQETLMLEVLERLADPLLYGTVALKRVRRWHRTPVTRENAPAIDIVDGEETTTSGKGCNDDREIAFTVSVFVRDDTGTTDADAIKVDVMRRLNPATAQWGAGILVRYGRIRPETDIADGDALRVDMEFTFRIKTAEWSLDAVAG